jgi:RND family efflux transporter MFP subunit
VNNLRAVQLRGRAGAATTTAYLVNAAIVPNADYLTLWRIDSPVSDNPALTRTTIRGLWPYDLPAPFGQAGTTVSADSGDTRIHKAIVRNGILYTARNTGYLSDPTTVTYDRIDLAQNRYDLAKGQHETALQAEALAKEGSRTQEIRAAEEAVNEARAALRQAQTGVVQARAAALQVDVRKKDVEVASAQVHQASAAVRSAEVGLSYTKVTAPFDGRVVGRMVDPGTMASPGVPLLAIEGGDPLLEAVVPERHLGGAAVGRTVDVQIDALGGRAIKGTVVETVPKGDATTHSFTVKIGLGHDPALKAGMFGTAVLPTGSVKRIFVPATAVWESDGLELVYALNSDGTARLRIVTLGEASGGRVEVLSGLSAGDRIVVGDRSGVSDGVTVKARAR